MNDRQCFGGNQSLSLTEELKSFKDVSYVSFTNEERCSVAAAAFDKYVEALCPQMNAIGEEVSNHILMVEADLSSNDGKPYDDSICQKIYQLCSDSSVKTSSGNDCVDPMLKLYTGCPLLVNSNNYLDQNVGRGTLCYLQKINLKSETNQRGPQLRIYNGRKISSIKASDIESISLTKVKNPKIGDKIVVIKPVNKTVDITVKGADLSLPLLKQKILQLDVLSGTACTGHRLQGQTKEALIVVGWTYKVQNWIYVVLSRVTTMRGIFFMEPIDVGKLKPPSQNLLRHEEEMHEKERKQNILYSNLNE